MEEIFLKHLREIHVQVLRYFWKTPLFPSPKLIFLILLKFPCVGDLKFYFAVANYTHYNYLNTLSLSEHISVFTLLSIWWKTPDVWDRVVLKKNRCIQFTFSKLFFSLYKKLISFSGVGDFLPPYSFYFFPPLKNIYNSRQGRPKTIVRLHKKILTPENKMKTLEIL